jgi:hypothetical protein
MHNCPHKLVSKPEPYTLMVPKPTPPLEYDEAAVAQMDVTKVADRKYHRPIIDVDF